MALYSFTGKRVLVTGGANGVGKEIVARFLNSGATVIALDCDSSALQLLKEEFAKFDLVTVEVDLCDWKATAEKVEKLMPLHHLVNNAGICTPKDFFTVTEADVDAHLDVNYKAAFNLSQVFAKGVISHGLTGGSIVHISSVIDRFTAIGFGPYSCSKAAITMLSRSLAAELGQYKIRSNVVRPDVMKTGLLTRFSGKVPERMEYILEYNQQRSCLKRLVEPRDLCQLVLFLSSDDSSMITGVDIAVDGGFSLT